MTFETRATKLLMASLFILVLSGCKDEYDFGEYDEIRNNGELSDVMHEWMHDYIEKYCRVQRDGSIDCE